MCWRGTNSGLSVRCCDLIRIVHRRANTATPAESGTEVHHHWAPENRRGVTSEKRRRRLSQIGGQPELSTPARLGNHPSPEGGAA